MTEQVTAELRDWHRVGKVIYGKIYGDTRFRFPDGHLIHTSKVVTITGDICVTRNSIYRLVGKEYNT